MSAEPLVLKRAEPSILHFPRPEPLVVETLRPEREAKWDRYVRRTPGSTFFHQLGWRWLVERGQVPEAELKDVAKEFTAAELDRWSIVSKTPMGTLQHLGPATLLGRH